MNDYEKSNSIVSVDYSRFSKKEYASLLKDGDRQVLSQNLVDYLCDKYKIRRIPVIVTSKPRKQIRGGQIYGFYKCLSRTKGLSITMYNTTAKTNKTVAIKTFADTLLHEFVHHYDTEYLHIDSKHTKGFYMRINDLKSKLQ